MAESRKEITIVRVTGKTVKPAPEQKVPGMQIIRVTHAEPLRLEMCQGRYFQAERSPQIKHAAQLSLKAVEGHEPYVDLPAGIDPRDVYRILNRENPQLFMLATSYEYIFNERMSRLYFTYVYSAEETERLKRELDDEITRIIRSARRRQGNVERLRYVYDWFSGNVTYHRTDNHPHEDFTAVGALIRRNAVCAGFSRAFQMICRRLGIDSAYICGKLEADSQAGHAWNLVWLDGYIYHVDITAGVNFFEASGRLSYPCFLTAAEDLLRSRIIETPFPRRDNPEGCYLASIGCRFNSPQELDDIFERFSTGSQRSLCIQAGADYQDMQKISDEIKLAMRKHHCGGTMYHYANGVCIIFKDTGRKTSGEIKIVKLTVL